MNFIETCDCERQGGVPSERQSGVPMSFIETCDCGRQGGVPMTRMSFIETWDCGVRDGVECLMTDGKEHTGTWDCERQYGVSMGFCERHYRVPMGFIETRDCERWGVVPTDRWRRVYVRLWEDGVPIGFIETVTEMGWTAFGLYCDLRLRDGVKCLWALLRPKTPPQTELIGWLYFSSSCIFFRLEHEKCTTTMRRQWHLHYYSSGLRLYIMHWLTGRSRSWKVTNDMSDWLLLIYTQSVAEIRTRTPLMVELTIANFTVFFPCAYRRPTWSIWTAFCVSHAICSSLSETAVCSHKVSALHSVYLV